jgi:hypothetical protein
VQSTSYTEVIESMKKQIMIARGVGRIRVVIRVRVVAGA